MRVYEAKKRIEQKSARLDSSRHELKELTAIIELIIDALASNDVSRVEPADIDTALNSLFVVRREMQRISDDIGEAVEAWKGGA